MKTSIKLSALAVVWSMAVLSGCRCGPTNQKSPKGEIGIVFTENNETKTLPDGVYDFGPVTMGSAGNLTVTVTNTGTGNLFLDSVVKDSGDNVEVGELKEEPVVFKLDFGARQIGPGESVTFPAVFYSLENKTSKEVNHQVKLLVKASNTEEGADTGSITLIARAISGECSLPERIDFGAVKKGGSADITVPIKNTRVVPINGYVRPITSSTPDYLAFKYTDDSLKDNFTIQPNRTKNIVVRFTPDRLGDFFASSEWQAADGCPKVAVKITGQGVEEVLTATPKPLDFGYAEIGAFAAKELVFRNLSTQAVDLTEFKTSKPQFLLNGTGDTSAAAPAKLTVPGATRDASNALVAGELKLPMSFKPALKGVLLGKLSFKTTLVSQPSGDIDLKGYGGGPSLDVKPNPLHFGKVAYFAGATPPSYVARKLTVRNVGSKADPLDKAANLHLGDKGAGAPYWTVQVNQGDASEICVGVFDEATQTCTGTLPTSVYDPAVGLEPSGAKSLVDVPVRITPKSTGDKSFVVTFMSNDSKNPQVSVTVDAQAVVLPPCDYELSPTSLNFGLVTPPSYKDIGFSIRNKSANPGDICLVSSVDIEPGSNPFFLLPAGAISDKELQPGETLNVNVRVWPTGQATTLTNIAGKVGISISNPTTPHPTVSLAATVASSCLVIAPDDLDFGTFKKGCNSSQRLFSIYNTCSTNVTLASPKAFEMLIPAGEKAGGPNCPGTSDCPEFFATDTAAIAAGTVIPPTTGATVPTFKLRYRPINYGQDTGAFVLHVIQNSQPVDYVVTLKGEGDTQGLNTDTFKQDSKPKADILLVVDNSCSMSDKQAAVAANFDSFIKYAVAQGVDYQIGITTTDMDSGGEQGKLITQAGNPKILTPNTPDVVNKFKQNVNVGINGSGTERTLWPAAAALTAPLINADNAGFLRPDAVLAVVAVTDEEEQSPNAVNFYVNQLLAIKGLQHANMFSYNAIFPLIPNQPGCSAGGQPDVRQVTAVTSTNGIQADICTPDWAKALEQIGQTAFGYRTTFYLTTQPDITGGNKVTVTIDGAAVPNIDSRGATVWTYDDVSNSVNFEPSYVPGPGQTMVVTYTALCQ